MKTAGPVQERSASLARRAWWGMIITSAVAFIATMEIRPEILSHFSEHLWGFIFPLIGVLGLTGMYVFIRIGHYTKAFLSSSAFIGGMLASTAFGLFPYVLPSSRDPGHSLTVYNTSAGAYGLTVGIVWWIVGIVLATGYFTYLFYAFRGKVKVVSGGY
jgi:cytochrome d ubiquinol oxidase subunit II